MDFKGWKKIAEDKKSVIMAHPKGHQMTIALKGLPKIQQEAIKRIKLEDGGIIDSFFGPEKSEAKTEKKDPYKNYSDKSSARDLPSQQEQEQKQQGLRKAFNYAEGTPDGTIENKDKVPAANITINAAPSDAAMGPVQQSPVPVPVNVPKAPPVPNTLMSSGSMNAPAAAQAGQQGLDLQAKIDAAKSAASVQQMQQYINQTQGLNQDFVRNINDLSQKAADLSEFNRQTPIKENAYIENMGAGKKMATAIGLLLGGAGSGIAGGSNPALDFLNQQIERNIAAQKDRFDRQKTVWGAYKDLYQNEQVANQMSRAHALDMLNHQAEMTAAQLGTPQAAANLLKLKSMTGPAINKAILDSAGLLQSTPNVPQGKEKGMPAEEISDQARNKTPVEQAMDIAAKGYGNKQQGEFGGAPGAEASISKETSESRILPADAEEKLNRVQYGSPKAREDYPEVKKQYTAAQQAEKMLKQINDIFPKMRQESTLSGNIRGKINPHAMGAMAAVPGAVLGGGGLGALTGGTLAIPGAMAGAGLAAGIGEGAGHAIRGGLEATGGQSEVQYQTDKAALSKFVIGALGNLATGQEIDNIVEANTPSYWDNEKTYQKKLNNIREFILSRLETSQLERYGLAPKGSKR